MDCAFIESVKEARCGQHLPHHYRLLRRVCRCPVAFVESVKEAYSVVETYPIIAVLWFIAAIVLLLCQHSFRVVFTILVRVCVCSATVVVITAPTFHRWKLTERLSVAMYKTMDDTPGYIFESLFDPSGVSVLKQLNDVLKEFGVVKRAMTDVAPVPDVGECIMGLDNTAVSVGKTIRCRDDTWTDIYAIISGITSFIPWSSEFDEHAAVWCPVITDEGPVYIDRRAFNGTSVSQRYGRMKVTHPYKYMPTKETICTVSAVVLSRVGV